MKKWVCIIYTAIFFGLCAAPFFGLILGHQNINSEKRALAAPPKIIKDGEINFDFTKQYDDYFTDNFAFRPNLITINAFLNAGLFGESVSEQVIIGKQGWLYFEPTLRDYKRLSTLTDNEVYRIARILEIQRDALNLKGVAFIFAVAPNKASIYGQYMPERYLTADNLSNAEKLFKQLDERGFEYADLFTPLRNHKSGTYHKQDTHWNNTGALIARNELLNCIQKKKQFSFKEYDLDSFVAKNDFLGDLGAMLYPAAQMKDIQHHYNVEKSFTTKSPMRSLEDLMISTESEGGELNAVMFRDSFANALIPILSNDFKSVTYSRAVPYNYSLLNSDTDAVILQIVERNLPDLLLSAPLITAPKTKIDYNLNRAFVDCAIDIEDMGAYLRIAGVAFPPGHDANKNYDIFLSVDDDQQVFSPFPIFEKEIFECENQYANAAFSMIIDKKDIEKKTNAIRAILFDGERYFVSKAQTVDY